MTIKGIKNRLCGFRFRPATGGILMLHSIETMNPGNLWENECLKFSPDSLRALVQYARNLGFEFVSIQEILARITSGRRSKKCLCITIDDGYRDVYEKGYPCFKELNVPACINVSTGIPDGRFIFWWHLLEDVLQSNDSLTLSNGMQFDLSSQEKKNKAFCDIREIILSMKQYSPQDKLRELLPEIELDFDSWTKGKGLTWEMINEMNADPLITIANHTANHPALFACTAEEVSKELADSQKAFVENIKEKPKYFAYPYGSVTKDNVDIITSYGMECIMTTAYDVIDRKTNVFALPRCVVHEKNWKYVINFINSKCRHF